MADPASGSHLVVRKREPCDRWLFSHHRDPCINAPVALSQVHLFMVLFTEVMFAYTELLCSAQPAFLSTSPALQVAYRLRPVIQWSGALFTMSGFPVLSVRALSTKTKRFWN